VAVVALTYQGEQFCSGTVVSPRTVITAGHCLRETGIPVTSMKVFFGTTVGSSGTTLSVVGGAAHPSYYVRSDGAPINDIAYLTLAQDAPVTPMAWQSTPLGNVVGKTVQLVGYGVTNAKYQTGNGTRRTYYDTIDDQDDIFLYYGGGTSGTCQGDSGGPMFLNVNGVKTLIAVTSYGDYSCLQLGANTRVDTYASFLAPNITGGGGTTPQPQPTTVTALSNGVAKTGLSGAQGSWQYFSIDVPSGQSSLTIATSGGTGDVDLYVKFGGLPNAGTYDYRPYLDGNTETVTISNPAKGKYYIGLNAYAAYSSVTLKATYTEASSGTTGSYAEAEPNDSLSQANVVNSSGTITGTIGTSTDSDIFKVVVPAGKTLGATLKVPADVDYDLKVYNSSGSVLARSENDLGLNESLTWKNTSSSSATVYVRVYGYNGSYTTSTRYELTLAW